MNKNGGITKCMCHKGFSGSSSIVARSNFRVSGQATTPQSLTAHSVPRSRTSVLRSKVLHAVNEMVEAVVSRTTSVAVQAEALNHQMVLR